MHNLPPLGEMLQELDRALFAIMDENDREFVEGIKMLVDMEEPVPQDAAQRIAKIYIQFQKAMHSAL